MTSPARNSAAPTLGVFDVVIQRLFAIGLTVESVAISLAGDERATKLSDAVAGLDATIREVRTHMTAPADYGTGPIAGNDPGATR